MGFSNLGIITGCFPFFLDYESSDPAPGLVSAESGRCLVPNSILCSVPLLFSSFTALSAPCGSTVQLPPIICGGVVWEEGMCQSPRLAYPELWSVPFPVFPLVGL